MYKIGIVGTSAITEKFLSTVNDNFSKKAFISSVYSRNENTKKDYCKKNNIKNGFTNYQEFLDSVAIVYIASPNSFHYDHALSAIKMKKHLIIEKPMAMTSEEIKHLYQLSTKYNVLIIEAVISVCNPIINDLKNYLKDIKHVNLNCMQQTRFINQYIKKEHVNVFDKNIGGGVMYDLGIYPIYFALMLLGSPKFSTNHLVQEDIYAPLSANMILNYENFNCNINVSKLVSSEKSYISTLKHLIVISNIATINTVEIYDHKNNLIETLNSKHDDMFYEIEHFLNLLDNNIFTSDMYTQELSLLANNLITT